MCTRFGVSEPANALSPRSGSSSPAAVKSFLPSMPSVPCWPLAYLEWLFALCLALQQELPLSEALAERGDGIPSASESEKEATSHLCRSRPQDVCCRSAPAAHPAPFTGSTPAQDPSWPSRPCTSTGASPTAPFLAAVLRS